MKLHRRLFRVRQLLQASGFVALIAVTLSYQNCAQQTAATGSSADSLGVASKSIPVFNEEDGVVSIGDQTENLNSMALSFVESQKTIPQDQSEVRADGMCSGQQNGAVLYYSFKTAQGQLVHEGFTQCQLSGFTVQFQLESPLSCEQVYKLEAQLGLGKKAEMNVSIACLQ